MKAIIIIFYHSGAMHFGCEIFLKVARQDIYR